MSSFFFFIAFYDTTTSLMMVNFMCSPVWKQGPETGKILFLGDLFTQPSICINRNDQIVTAGVVSSHAIEGSDRTKMEQSLSLSESTIKSPLRCVEIFRAIRASACPRDGPIIATVYNILLRAKLYRRFYMQLNT